MDGHQNPSNDITGAGDGPAPKKPCLIETPIPGTPDNGSDFYNTPLAAGTPDMGITGLNTGNSAAEPSTSSKPSHMIPGLNLIHHLSGQENGSHLAEHTIKQEQDQLVNHQEAGTETKQEETQHISQLESTEAVMKEEPEAQIKNEPTAPLDEAMDVAQDTYQDNMIEATGRTGDVNEDDHPEWEEDSSPYESSSDSSDSSDSDDSDDEDYPILSAEEQAQILMRAEGGSDDEGDGKGKPGGQLRTTNEIEQEILPIPDVKITPEMKIVFLGKVHAAIDNNVLIEANTSGEYQVLESGSLLCSDDRQTIGVVAETLGRVENPLYTVSYATASEVQEKGLVKGKDIFYVEDHSTFVFTQPLKGLKGSDASNFHDEEVAAEEMEFSDDEAEAEYKRKLKQKRQERKEAREGPRGKKPAPGPSKLNQTELNYDDAGGEEGYTPLARPTNLHEMMNTREPPVEGNERGGFRGGRGRGRGGDRGDRGDRGRGGRGRGGRGGREWDQDRRPQQAGGSTHEPQPQPQPQAQPAAPYSQPMYQQPQQPYGMPQSFAPYAQYAQQQAQNPQQPQFGQGGAQPQMPFQFPPYAAFQQQQPNNFQNLQQGAQYNPQSMAILQQQQQFLQLLQQQQQYQQSQQHYQQPQHQPQHQHQQQQHQPSQAQTPAMNFDQVKAQLDLLRNLHGGNQGPPPS
ncbi:Translation elongation/initiation factor/Ribosomal beta-barrel [Penicillium cf. griseofulvum]|uniref:H/ACA ribonucleoprotein complex non-core subunit NAF1 n=1 Tax=Penicillium cf. griseofulvum TaxID=2972120 RepID=A0A9W9IUP0_9EURO|nr:Translation elongation/initiation factor/Ribosomal beta-barrel [Penicillium cf. griseofulvum]KAJ5430762.1 Translation elongation/initiation factor/Ribosomal beta-barrel [Penicillium cf. griseofulvum]KAJ5435468.1 Translation elongation/initiation factor/Ribosomal beta-barrel [Penicillium cf. griseofulvum]